VLQLPLALIGVGTVNRSKIFFLNNDLLVGSK
jgi:hypothetical protein